MICLVPLRTQSRGDTIIKYLFTLCTPIHSQNTHTHTHHAPQTLSDRHSSQKAIHSMNLKPRHNYPKCYTMTRSCPIGYCTDLGPKLVKLFLHQWKIDQNIKQFGILLMEYELVSSCCIMFFWLLVERYSCTQVRRECRQLGWT